MAGQRGFWDVEYRLQELSKQGDPLEKRRRRVGCCRRGLDLLDRDRQVFEGQLALVCRQLLRLPAVQRMTQFLDQRFKTPVRYRQGGIIRAQGSYLCLLRLKGRPVFRRQDAQVEIAWGS